MLWVGSGGSGEGGDMAHIYGTMEGDLGASDHRRAVPEPMAMPGDIGLVETPEDAVESSFDRSEDFFVPAGINYVDCRSQNEI